MEDDQRREKECKSLVVTDPVNISSYFDDFSELLQTHLNNESMDPIFPRVELTKTEMGHLHSLCNPQLLTVEGEIPTETNPESLPIINRVPLSYDYDLEEGKHLKIITSKEKWKKLVTVPAPYTIPVIRVSDNTVKDLIPYKDVVVSVKVYHPFKYSIENNNKTNIKVAREIAILPRQTLADLRDKIVCATDMGYGKEIEHPDEELISAKETYPSGFIFIENCFYNDMRYSNAIDYSEVIRQWAEKHGVGMFTTGDIMKVKISDLNIKFGFPYLYQHQGNCEHVLIFTDARLLNKHDYQSSADYPYIAQELDYNISYCFICGKHAAKYLVTNSDRLPHKNSLFCRKCLLSYNYIGREKLGNFSLYHHSQRF